MIEDELQAQWLCSVVKSLVQVRKKAGLTQAQVAERMGTHQAEISRIENKKDGSMSLHRFVDYALACGYIPLNLVTAQDSFFQAWYPVFREANPGVPFTRENLLAWNEHVKRYGTNRVWKPFLKHATIVTCPRLTLL